MPSVHLTGDTRAGTPLLSTDPNALLLGMLLDQQVPMEKAFAGPEVLRERLGGLDVAKIAAMDPDAFEKVCSERPAIHRFLARGQAHPVVVPGAGRRLGRLGGHPVRRRPGADLKKRILALPGFGEQKARILVARRASSGGSRPARGVR